MTQEDADAVFAAGWSEQALADAICVCAHFNMVNRLVEGLGAGRHHTRDPNAQGGLTGRGEGLPVARVRRLRTFFGPGHMR